MINFYKKTSKDKELKKINSYAIGCWINVINPTEAELEDISKKYDLDLEILLEGIDQNELPRIEKSENSIYIYVKATSKHTFNLSTLLIIINDNFIMTISKDEISTIQLAISSKINISTSHKLASLIQILYGINNEMEKKVISIVKNVQIKKNATTKLKESDIESLLNAEDFLNNLASTYSYTTVLYSKIIKNIKFQTKERKLLQDLIIESEEGLNICRTSLKTISNIRNYYSITISTKLNKAIRLLTVFTVLMSIPAAIGALYGMNVPLPSEDSANSFYVIVLIVLALIGSFGFYIKKLGWF